MNLAVQVAGWVAARRRTVRVAAHLPGHLPQGTQRPDTCRYARSVGRRTRTGPADRFRVHRPSAHRHLRMAHLHEHHTEVASKHRILARLVYIQHVLLLFNRAIREAVAVGVRGAGDHIRGIFLLCWWYFPRALCIHIVYITISHFVSYCMAIYLSFASYSSLFLHCQCHERPRSRLRVTSCPSAGPSLPLREACFGSQRHTPALQQSTSTYSHLQLSRQYILNLTDHEQHRAGRPVQTRPGHRW